MRKCLWLCAFAFVSLFAEAQTSAVTGTIDDPSATNAGTVQLRFTLGGCAGNQPRYNGSYLITGETDGANVSKTFTATAGAISGTMVRSDFVTCGTSTTSNYWAMRVIRNGVAGPACNVRITAATFDANQPTCLNANPTINLSTLSSLTYLLLDASNAPITGLLTAKGLQGVRDCASTFYASLSACISDVPTGGVAYIPDNTTLTTATTISISKRITVQCGNRDTSILKTTGAVPLFTGSGLVTSFAVRNCTLDGNSTGTSAFVVGDFSSSVLEWSEARINFENNLIKGFTSWAILQGQSTYFSYIAHNYFTNNNGDISTDRYSEPTIFDNMFYLPATGATNQQVKMVATSVGSITYNTFIGRSTVTACNLLLAGPSSDDTGPVVAFNKFGSEQENASRIKVCFNGTATKPIYGVRFIGNILSCGLASMTAIKFDSPVGDSVFVDNTFNYCSTLLNDNQPIIGQDTGNNGNVWGNNTVVKRPGYPVTRFTNNGRGFSSVAGSNQSALVQSSWNPRHWEPFELRNRVAFSEALDNAAWTKNNITITTGQTDPKGGTNAVKVAHSTSNSDNANVAVDTTGMGSAVNVSFWAKAGTTTDLTVLFYDTTTGAPVCDFRPNALTTAWQYFAYRCAGIDNSHTFKVYLYPDLGGGTTGDLYFYGLQVQDYDGPYVKTAATVASSATQGTPFQFAASLSTAAATSDNVAIIGVTSASHCVLTPTNASAATNIATTYISAKTTNQITVTHTATGSMTYDIACSGF